MITFNVVKEPHGWAVRIGEHMTTNYWSRERAVQGANRLAGAIHRNGGLIEVIVEGLALVPPPAVRRRKA